MAIALNFTAPLKQDPEAQQQLKELVAIFAEKVQPVIDAALAKAKTVHFARLLVIDNKYIQILTEFDGDPMEYTEFFRKELGPIFQKIFSLVEGAAPWDELNNANSFYEYTRTLDLPSLGTSTVGNEGRGYLFSAVGDTTARELQAALRRGGSTPAPPSPAPA